MAPIIKSVPAAELVNPSQQNNVFQFVQTTKPTERSAGVALVAGDRWYKTDDGTEWFWNGSYWLSLEEKRQSITTTVSETSTVTLPVNSQKSIFIEKITVKSFVKNYNNASNYWSGSVDLNEEFSIVDFLYSSDDAGVVLETEYPLSFYYNEEDGEINLVLKANLSKTGNPGDLTFKMFVDYREVFEDIDYFLGYNLSPDYWIDASTGNDSNDGSESFPWASLNKINTLPLPAGETVVVRVKSGTYNKATDYVAYTTGGLDSHLKLVFEPSCIMDGVNMPGSENGFEFSGANTWTTTIYGNGLQVKNFIDATSNSPNGGGNRNTHILYCFDVTADNCEDGFSCHGDAQMYLYDCVAQNCTKGETIHVDNAYVEHHRCEIIASGTNNGNYGSATILFYDCKITPSTSTGKTFVGGSFYRCQIGTLNDRFQFIGGGVIEDSFINIYIDGNATASLNRCFGKLSLRVRTPGGTSVENCVITAPATGQTGIVFSNFNGGGNCNLVVNNNIFESASFMSVDSTSAAYLVNGGSQFFNNILFRGATYDPDLIAADSGGTVIVGTITNDPLIGAGNTLNSYDYGYASGSPAIGAAFGGGNIGFSIGEVDMPQPRNSGY
jgi:hypothetical protein